MSESRVCNESDFETEWFQRIRKDLGMSDEIHRKVWELCFIVRTLERYGLGLGQVGLGFGVGEEPLADYFRSRGCAIIATDMPSGEKAGAWTRTGQHSASAYPVDMNAIPRELQRGQFDFVWSTSSFEHLGSILAGLEFWRQMKLCLRLGGVAVHVTEYNTTSDTKTIDSRDLVLFRKSDILFMDPKIDLTLGYGPLESQVAHAIPDRPHLRLSVGEFVTTSVGLVYRR